MSAVVWWLVGSTVAAVSFVVACLYAAWCASPVDVPDVPPTHPLQVPTNAWEAMK